MNETDTDCLEMPFGPPPILPDIRTELKDYIIDPEKLPIHQLDNVQQYWQRKFKILSLFHNNLAPFGTNVKYTRDPITGCISDVQEVCAQNVGKTVRNSMSMSRAPDPVNQNIKGNSSNYLFWPGGFDEPQYDTVDNDVEVNFENNLKTSIKEFRGGIEFMPDNHTPKVSDDEVKNANIVRNRSDNEKENINLLSVVDKEAHSLPFWGPSCKDQQKKKIIENKLSENVDIPCIDAVLEPIKESKIPVLKISEPITNKQINTEWAKQLDVTMPVTDFEHRIPEPAMVFPYELDNFQKQAILKLEENCDVFVAAHTSAGKTTIAEYAIAISIKHMTRTIYTSPIKALSNQKFREFKDKFDNVGLITGDIQINPTAMCLVMTTEILQSMLYCAAEILRDVEYVIFDEVHYISQEDRGHVWEEVIILLPPTIKIVMLSATVPNPIEFAYWVGQIKKRKMYVISTLKRPIPLQHYLYTGHDTKSKDQIFLLVDKNGQFFKESIQQAAAVLKKAADKKDNYIKHKPSLVMMPQTSVLKNTSAEKAIEAVAVAEKKQESYEDKVMNAKFRRMWLALLDHLRAGDKLPVVIFALSRKICDTTVSFFSQSLLTPPEQSYVVEFFQKSIRHLKGTDSQLPQVLKMKRLLTMGIGIHHTGILPILKEIVEMLFQKGIVKVLFATETFAMGVNMPAKTVVFDSVRKFDGENFRYLLPTEYTQMAGRAGRRGHDKLGEVLIFCKDRILHENDLKKMVLGTPQTLISKFKVTYPMVLRLTRLSEAVSVNEMMRRSFKEVHTLSNQKVFEKELQKITELIENIPPLEEHEKELEKLYESAANYLEIWKELRPYLMQTKKALKVLTEGRVLLINHKHHCNKLAILLSIDKTKFMYKVFVLTSIAEENEAKANQQSEIWYYVTIFMKQKWYEPPKNVVYSILTVPASSIVEITNAFVGVTSRYILADWAMRQIPTFKDVPYNVYCQTAIDVLTRISHDVKTNPSVILPYVELKLNELAFQKKNMVLKVNTVVLQSFKNKIMDPHFEKKFEQVFYRKDLQRKKQELIHKLSVEYLQNYPDYTKRLKVLKELNYINDEDRVTLKGRVALEMGRHEILLTEMLLDNILTNWESEKIAAMLSTLVFERRNKKEQEKEFSKLNELQNEMMKVHERLVKIEAKYDLDPIPKPSFDIIGVAYEWARGKSFAEIVKLTDIQEGLIVRCIQQLNEVLLDVRNAAIIIGHPALKEKMEQASMKIKRDIVFTASLYTQD